MSNDTNNQVLKICSSDGVVYSLPKQIILQHTSHFNDLLNSPKDSNYPIDVSINVEETSNVLGPLVAMMDSRISSAKMDLDNFTALLSTYETASRYGFIKLLEQIRVDLRPKAIGDKTQRESIMRVAIQYKDQNMLDFLFMLNESEVPNDESKSNQVPPRSHRNQEEDDQPLSQPSIPSFAPPSSPPPSLHPNQARPQFPSFSSSATFVDQNPESANGTRIISVSTDDQSRPHLSGHGLTQTLSPRNPEGVTWSTAASPPPPPPAYHQEPGPIIAEIPLNNNPPVPQSMAAEYANVNALKYQLRQAQARNAHPDVIADHHLRYSMAESALADKLGLYTPVKEPTIAMEPVLAPLPPIFAHVLREPMAPAEPIANAREKPRGTSFVRKRFRPAHNMERGGAYPQPRGPALSSSTAIYCLGLIFGLFLLGGFGTELGLSIVIGQGLQKATLNSSLVQTVQCAKLGSSRGSCNIPYHWSRWFAYVSPILALSASLWTWFCDNYIVLRSTKIGWSVTAVAVIGAAVGTTQLSVSGYSTSNCSTCSLKSVYVPTSQLRMMNRGQTVGAWLVLVGLIAGMAFRARRLGVRQF